MAVDIVFEELVFIRTEMWAFTGVTSFGTLWGGTR